MIRRAALLAVFVATASQAATLRYPLTDDIQRCVTATVDMLPQTGKVRLILMLRPDGVAYAAYVHNFQGVDDRRLQRCIANQSMVWTWDPAETAYERPFEVQFNNGVIFLPDANKVPKYAALDVETAQATLDIDDKATNVERGAALVDVHKYDEAIKILRNDASADGAAYLARAIAESNGNLPEARQIAQNAIAAAPKHALAHESLLRVCMAQQDRECMADEWKAMTACPDFLPRVLVVNEQLQLPVQRAICELNATAEKKDPAECRKLSLKLEPQPEDDSDLFVTNIKPEGPRRSPVWWGLGAYGLASIFAGMGAVTGEAITNTNNRSGVYTDHTRAYKGAVIGAAVGILPGILFGEVSRKESNEQGRHVITLLDIGGTMALLVAYSVVSRDR